MCSPFHPRARRGPPVSFTPTKKGHETEPYLAK